MMMMNTKKLFCKRYFMYFLKYLFNYVCFFIIRSHIWVGHLLRRSIPQTNLSVTFQFCRFRARFPPLVDGLSSQLWNQRRQRDDLLDRLKKKRNLFLRRQCSDKENIAFIIVGYNNLDTNLYKKVTSELHLLILNQNTSQRKLNYWTVPVFVFYQFFFVFRPFLLHNDCAVCFMHSYICFRIESKKFSTQYSYTETLLPRFHSELYFRN